MIRHTPLRWISENVVFPPQAGQKLAGKPVGPHLLPFQKDFIRAILDRDGGIKKSGFIYGCRKVSKSFLFTAILFYLLCSKRIGFEVPVCASTFNQSKVLFGQLAAQLNSKLGKQFELRKEYIRHKETNNKAHIIYNSPGGNLGLESSGAIFDECAAFDNFSNMETIQSGLALSEDKPLLLYSSNPAETEDHPCLTLLKAAKADPQFYVKTFCLPKGADWKKEASWIETNPFLKAGADCKWKRFKNVLLNYRMLYRRALESQSAELSFRRLQLGETLTASGLDFIPPEKIKSVKGFDFKRKDVRWACGVDISQTHDFSAMSFVAYKEATDQLWTFNFLYLPNMHNRRPAQKRQFRIWSQHGLIEHQDEKVLNPNSMFEDFEKFIQKTGIELEGLQIDPSLAASYIEFFQERVKVAKDRMSGRSMTMSVKELQRIGLAEGLYVVGNNLPVVRWMASNVMIPTASKTYVIMNRQGKKTENNIDCMVSISLALKFLLDRPYSDFPMLVG